MGVSKIILSFVLERLVDLGRQLYFIVKGDGAQFYLKNISLHLKGWLDLWGSPLGLSCIF